jgi:hypothetical protein
MRDVAAIFAEAELVDRFDRKPRREPLENAHARRRIRKSVACIKARRIDGVVVRLPTGGKTGIAVIDAASVGHAPEQRGLAWIFAELGFCKGQKCIVDVVGRNRRGDPVDVGGCHPYLQRRRGAGLSYGRRFGDSVSGWASASV